MSTPSKKQLDLNFNDITNEQEKTEQENWQPVEKRPPLSGLSIAIPYGKKFKHKDLAICTNEEFFKFFDFIYPGGLTEAQKTQKLSTADRIALVEMIIRLNEQGGILKLPKTKKE